MKPTVLSLFSGVGGFDLGLERAGFEVVAQADNDPFCNKVLAKHWPEVRRYTDVRDIRLGPAQRDEQGQPNDGEAHQPDFARGRHVDLVCGGFPCQDLSVAGKRAGLAGDRSGLWFEFHRILSELRPTFALIENVPGLLSSNEGRDFAVILRGLGELGYVCGWAVLDSQHFGVPQRRRRVYVVAGPTRESVQQILSLCEGGDWHPQKGRAPGQDVARPLGASATSFGGWRGDLDHETYIPSIAGTLGQSLGHHGLSHDLDGHGAYIAHTLSADGVDASEDGTGRGTPLVSVRTAQTGYNGWGVNEDGTAYTLDGSTQAVAYGLDSELNGANELMGPLKVNPGGGGERAKVASGASVRRLTPVECERLQGFPDHWTDLGNTPDGPRYKAMGNAVSVPVVEYLGRRIMEVLSALP